MDRTDRTLPHNLEAEKAVLGAVLISPLLWSVAESRVRSTDFFRDAHRKIYEAIGRLMGASVVPDPLTLRDDLQKHGELDDCGGPAYISSLTDGVPYSANVEYYAQIVAEKSRLRRVIQASTDALVRAYDAEHTASEIVQDAVHRLSEEVGQTGSRPLNISVGVDAYLASLVNGVELLPTGFTDLDEIIGGLVVGDLNIIAARPSVGKTSLALGIGKHLAQHLQKRGAMFSLEMSREQLGGRMVLYEARVDGHKLRMASASEDEYARVLSAKGALEALPFDVDEMPRSVAEIAAWCRRLRQEHGRLDFVVIDYLQLLLSGGTRHDSRQAEVAAISRDLKRLARSEKLSVLAVSQLSRAPEGRKDKRPHVSDLRESGALEQDADVVLLLHRPEMHREQGDAQADETGVAECIVAKNRNGPVGMARLAFIQHWSKFENLAR